MGIRVKPGKSIIVKFGQFAEYTSKMMGLSIIFLRVPQILSVRIYILCFTFVKFVIFSGIYANWA